MQHCRDLRFDQSPNYRYLKNLFESLFRELHFEDDGQFDWVISRQAILDRKMAELEAERRQKAAAERFKMQNGMESATASRLLEEEERKRKVEEEKKAEKEEAKKFAKD